MDSAGKALSPIFGTPILEALYNVVNVIPGLREPVGPGMPGRTESIFQYRLEYRQTGRVFLQRHSAHAERESWQDLAGTTTVALEMVYKLEITPNCSYAFSSCDWRDLHNGRMAVAFSRLVLEKTSPEPDQKGKVLVYVSFQISQKPGKISRAISHFRRPFSERP